MFWSGVNEWKAGYEILLTVDYFESFVFDLSVVWDKRKVQNVCWLNDGLCPEMTTLQLTWYCIALSIPLLTNCGVQWQWRYQAMRMRSPALKPVTSSQPPPWSPPPQLRMMMTPSSPSPFPNLPHLAPCGGTGWRMRWVPFIARGENILKDVWFDTMHSGSPD